MVLPGHGDERDEEGKENDSLDTIGLAPAPTATTTTSSRPHTLTLPILPSPAQRQRGGRDRERRWEVMEGMEEECVVLTLPPLTIPSPPSFPLPASRSAARHHR